MLRSLVGWLAVCRTRKGPSSRACGRRSRGRAPARAPGRRRCSPSVPCSHSLRCSLRQHRHRLHWPGEWRSGRQHPPHPSGEAQQPCTAVVLLVAAAAGAAVRRPCAGHRREQAAACVAARRTGLQLQRRLGEASAGWARPRTEKDLPGRAADRASSCRSRRGWECCFPSTAAARPAVAARRRRLERPCGAGSRVERTTRTASGPRSAWRVGRCGHEVVQVWRVMRAGSSCSISGGREGGSHGERLRWQLRHTTGLLGPADRELQRSGL